jgi:transposase
MRGRIGCPTRIITPVPHMQELAKGETKELSQKAKFRLKVFDWYYHKSALYSLSGLPDASLTCRHFGIHRSYFYRWKARYDKRRLSSLENRSTRPQNPRQPSYSRELIGKAKQIRTDDPSYSARKIRPNLLRTQESVPSVSTIGRLISRENLFFRAGTKLHKKRSQSAKKPMNGSENPVI